MSKPKFEKNVYSVPGSRMSTLLNSLDKLNSRSPDDVDQLRFLTAKIQHCLRDHEKVRKEVMSKTTNGLEILFATIESSKDSQVSMNVTYSLLELLQSLKRAQSMVSRGATEVLLTALSTASKQQPVCEELMAGLHQVLAKIGPKDRKFGVKARLSGAVPITLGIVRVNAGNLDAVHPMVQVLKIYATNSVNSSHLGKSGAVSSMLKIVSICGKRYHPVLRTALETLGLLVKSKSNSARAIGQGGMPMLLHAFCEWQKGDVRNRHLNMRKGILIVIKNITTLKSGKRAFVECDGVKILYAAAQDMLNSNNKDTEGLVNQICIVQRKCFPKGRLPVPTIISCVPYDLPVVPEGHILLQTATGDDMIDESDDQDDDISSGEETKEEEPQQHEGADRREVENSAATERQHRTPEDLAVYLRYFPELTDFEEILNEAESDSEDTVQPQAGDTIHIPTAKPDSPKANSRMPGRQTMQRHENLRENRFSLPNLSKYSCLVTNQHASDDSNINTKPSQLSSTRHRSFNNASANSWFPVENQESPLAGHFNLGGSHLSPNSAPLQHRTTTTRVWDKQSRSFHHLRRSVSPTKGNKHLSPERHPSAHSMWGIGDEQPTNGVDFVRSSMTISRMTLASPVDAPASELSLTDEISWDEVKPDVYGDMLGKTERVVPFRRIAHPEIHGHIPGSTVEECYEKSTYIQRLLQMEDIDRYIHPQKVTDRVVYNLDELMKSSASRFIPSSSEAYSSKSGVDGESLSLVFNSLFESGNLRRAIQVRKHEYDLIVRSDINSNHHHQWFYFEVSNIKAGVRYRFNIINCEKASSQFNFGMQPVMYSVREAMEGRPGWVRCGSELAYYKNNYQRSSAATGGPKGKTYFTFVLTLNFKHNNDTCYIAYHYPYTFTTLQMHLAKLEASLGEFSNIYLKRETLCQTLGGNECPVLTITANPSFDKEGIVRFRSRGYVFLSARVHPGESNSSFIMKGVLRFLVSGHPTAQALRELFIFKIVPMLNPDGVINGSHRCSLSGEDLNRRWLLPIKELHPTIYHTKGLLQYLALIDKSPVVYCDFHGHSRKKNVFMYGNSAAMSYTPDDLNNFGIPSGVSGAKVEDTSYKTLPRILNNIAPAFSLSNCSFVVDKGKESAARVVVWREMGVARSYTMESTYCGFDQGKYKGLQVTTAMLEEMGQHFCEGLHKLARRIEAAGTACRHLYSQSGGGTPEASEGGGSSGMQQFMEENDPDDMVDMELETISERKRSHPMTDLKEEMTPSENDNEEEDVEEDEDEDEEEDGQLDEENIYQLRQEGARKLTASEEGDCPGCIEDVESHST